MRNPFKAEVVAPEPAGCGYSRTFPDGSTLQCVNGRAIVDGTFTGPCPRCLTPAPTPPPPRDANGREIRVGDVLGFKPGTSIHAERPNYRGVVAGLNEDYAGRPSPGCVRIKGGTWFSDTERAVVIDPAPQPEAAPQPAAEAEVDTCVGCGAALNRRSDGSQLEMLGNTRCSWDGKWHCVYCFDRLSQCQSHGRESGPGITAAPAPVVDEEGDAWMTATAES